VAECLAVVAEAGQFCQLPSIGCGTAPRRSDGSETNPRLDYGDLIIRTLGGWLKDLWRKTCELLWKYPVLWLPVLVADLGTSLLSLPRYWAIHSMVTEELERHQLDIAGTRSASVSFFLGAPFTWGTHFIDLCLFTLAFVTTAELVRMALRNERPKISFAAQSLRVKALSVFGFSLKVLGPCLIALIFSGYLQSWFATVIDPNFFATTVTMVDYLVFCVVRSAIAYVVTPSAVRLLRDEGFSSINAREKRLARGFGILAVLVSAVISVICAPAVPPLVRGAQLFGARLAFTEALLSFCVALPYAPLFVTLALIAFKEDTTHDVVGEASLESL
jgi:hypothetical protein